MLSSDSNAVCSYMDASAKNAFDVMACPQDGFIEFPNIKPSAERRRNRVRVPVAGPPPHTTSACGAALGGSSQRSKLAQEISEKHKPLVLGSSRGLHLHGKRGKIN